MQTEGQSAWQRIISSNEYKEAEKTGKIVNFVTYKNNEKVDDDANYFLMKMDDEDFSILDKTVGIKIKINETDIFDISLDNSYRSTNLEAFVLPLFCFEDENVSSIEELNFKALKKCEKNQQKKYIVVSLADNVVEKHNIELENKEFSKWHATTPEVKLERFLSEEVNGSNHTVFKGKMLKIFHKEYKPTTNLNS